MASTVAAFTTTSGVGATTFIRLSGFTVRTRLAGGCFCGRVYPGSARLSLSITTCARSAKLGGKLDLPLKESGTKVLSRSPLAFAAA